MAKYSSKYDPDKKLPATHYRNQGFSGSMYSEFDLSKESQEKRIFLRGESYDSWKKSEHKISQNQLKEGPGTKIGSVASSWLTSLGYITDTGEAVATFIGVNAEFYYKMPYETFLEWLNSPSKGRWLHDSGYMHNYKVSGGTGRKKMQSRIAGVTKRERIGSNGTARAKARVRNYLAKYR